MEIVEIIIIGIGLSADAFAVAVCKGLSMDGFRKGHAAVIALFFGGLQALMPLFGWLLGSGVAGFVKPAAPWIAFGLLAFIGGKMLVDALKDDNESELDSGSSSEKPLFSRAGIGELFMLAIATSIDALFAGVSLAMTGANIAVAAPMIGCITFALSFAGVAIGSAFGGRWQKPSQIAGGIILIAIGLKILLEGLGVLF